MKTIENITIYKCDFCKKELKRKHAMEKHEKECLNNPINHRACILCTYLVKEKKNVWFENTAYHPDYGNEEGEYREVDVLKCDKLKKFMYPYSIEKRDIVERYPSTFEDQEPMPKQCDDFSYGFNF